MRIAFPYEGIPSVDVPDPRLMAVVGPRDQAPSAPADFSSLAWTAVW